MSSLHKISVSVILFFFSLTASGGNPFAPSAGAVEAGMGYACIMKPSFWSSFHNQALLAFYKSFAAGTNYINRFNIKELGTSSFSLIVPAGKASLGAIYNHFGYTEYKREMAGVACGLKLDDKISGGIQIDYFSERTSLEYSNVQSLTCEAGLLIIPSEKISVGVHIFNPVPNTLRKTYLPTSVRAGAGLYLSQILFTAIEAEMSSGNKLRIRTGFEYEAAKNGWVRGGFDTENNSFSFGLGYMLKVMKIDLGFIIHDKLGVTSSLSLIYKIH